MKIFRHRAKKNNMELEKECVKVIAMSLMAGIFLYSIQKKSGHSKAQRHFCRHFLVTVEK